MLEYCRHPNMAVKQFSLSLWSFLPRIVSTYCASVSLLVALFMYGNGPKQALETAYPVLLLETQL